MVARFEELAHAATPRGEVSLRRRRLPGTEQDVFEVLLGEEYLMSSLFTVAEEELGRLALAAVPGDGPLRVVVGGLGLGCTAAAVLEDPRVERLEVVDAFEEVLDWHRRGLLPLSDALHGDPRCTFVLGDFFALTASGDLPAPCDAVVVDIDHTPAHLLHPSHGGFYTAPGLGRLAGQLRPGGVFALWSDDPPEPRFEALLAEVFATTRSHVVPFANPLTGGTSTNTVYVATTGDAVDQEGP